jgi:hypothetical protein
MRPFFQQRAIAPQGNGEKARRRFEGNQIHDDPRSALRKASMFFIGSLPGLMDNPG